MGIGSKVILIAVVAIVSSAQPAESGAAFSVASVKRITSARPEPIGEVENDSRVSYTHIPLYFLICRAYEIECYRIAGLSPISGQDVYDVVANLPEGSRKKQIPAMLRNLLATRFHLVAHWDTRETSVFVLDVAEGGLLLKRSSTPPDDSTGHPVRAMTDPATGRTHLQDTMTLARLTQYLSGVLRRTDGPAVVDRTGTAGEFDIVLDARLPVLGDGAIEGADKGLRLADGTTVSSDAPSIFVALKKLGLTLTPTKELLNYLVIDSVDKQPVDN